MDKDRSKDLFKTCPKCHENWYSRDAFLRDPTIDLIGYQANFSVLELGLILFNHGCGTTLAVHAQEFTDLHDGPVFAENLNASEDPCYCTRTFNTEPCPKRCSCKFGRDIIQEVKDWRALHLA